MGNSELEDTLRMWTEGPGTVRVEVVEYELVRDPLPNDDNADNFVGGARDEDACEAAHHSRRPVSVHERSLIFRA